MFNIIQKLNSTSIFLELLALYWPLNSEWRAVKLNGSGNF